MFDGLVGSPEDAVLLCGALVLVLAGGVVPLAGRRVQLAFAYLLFEGDRAVGRQELIGAVWPDAAPENPTAALRTVLSRLRCALGAEAVVGRARIRLELPPATYIDLEAATYIDLEAARAHAATAEAALRGGDWATAAAAARSAVRIMRAGLLEGLDAPWIEQRRRELYGQCVRALEVLATAELRRAEPDLIDAERAARALIDLAPLREGGHRLLMEALAARGEIPEALQAYDRARCLLREELGIAPGPELVSLHRKLVCAGPPLEAEHRRLADALAAFGGDAEALRAAVTSYLSRPANP